MTSYSEPVRTCGTYDNGGSPAKCSSMDVGNILSGYDLFSYETYMENGVFSIIEKNIILK